MDWSIWCSNPVFLTLVVEGNTRSSVIATLNKSLQKIPSDRPTAKAYWVKEIILLNYKNIFSSFAVFFSIERLLRCRARGREGTKGLKQRGRREIMSTNLHNTNKRITKQIRVSLKIHRELKLRAIQDNSTISKLADYIIDKYLKKTNNQNYEKWNNEDDFAKVLIRKAQI